MRQAYDYWQDQPGYYQTNATFSRTERLVGRANRIQHLEPFSIPTNTGWNVKCQAYKCDWETNLTQATKQAAMHPNSFPPRQSSRNPEISELRLILKTFVPFQFNFTHWVNHNQSFPALADTSKGRKDWADTNSSNAAFRLNQAEWDIKALAITQIWKAERWIISNSLQYSCLGPDRHSHSKCLMFWLQSASHTDLTAEFFNFGPFTHVFMHNPLPWALKCWNSACKQIVHAGSKYICEYLAILAPKKKGPKMHRGRPQNRLGDPHPNVIIKFGVSKN